MQDFEAIKEALIDKWAANMPINELIDYYKEGTADFLNEFNNDDLLKLANDYGINI